MFAVGQYDIGNANWKYATAISPARMNATGRVNSPMRMSGPPNVSSTPANHGSENVVMGGAPAGSGGKLNSFIVPEVMNMPAATMRNTASIRSLSDCGAGSK